LPKPQQPPQFTPKFDLQTTPYWAARYSDSQSDDAVAEVAQRARERGYLTRADFLQIARWKSPRSKPASESNTEEYVREVTRIAFSTSSERLRIGVLTLLEGVSWPTASAILHLAYPDRYPILDVRALWSLGYDSPPIYNFAFWEAYTAYTREQAERCGLTMRDFDRALWQYAKEHQP
jgi:hypothetical protein